MVLKRVGILSERNEIKMILCPCKGCTDRSIGCHSTCVEYNAWVKQHTEMMNDLKRLSKNVVHSHDFLGTSPPPGKHIKKKKKRYGKS